MTGLRHQVRVAALQILFEVDATTHPLDMVLARRIEEDMLQTEGRDFLRHLAIGAWEHRLYLDHIIEEAAPHWPLDQMSGIDKTILRIALFELLVDNIEQTPVKAVINEAVELAKHFGSDNSSRFINGVLGTIVVRYT